jgi:hypothetical protein
VYEIFLLEMGWSYEIINILVQILPQNGRIKLIELFEHVSGDVEDDMNKEQVIHVNM